MTLYHAHALVATHPRALRRGHRHTHPDHLPPAKVVALMASPAWRLRQAHDIGPQTTALIGQLLGERPLDRLRSAMAIVGLTKKYPPRRLEAACARALTFQQVGYGVVKRILQHGLDAIPAVPAAVVPEPPARFTRPWTDFFAQEA